MQSLYQLGWAELRAHRNILVLQIRNLCFPKDIWLTLSQTPGWLKACDFIHGHGKSLLTQPKNGTSKLEGIILQLSKGLLMKKVSFQISTGSPFTRIFLNHSQRWLPQLFLIWEQCPNQANYIFSLYFSCLSRYSYFIFSFQNV